MDALSSEILFNRTLFSRREEQWSHISYQDELRLLEAVKRGEMDKVSARIGRVFPIHTGHLSVNPHRQAIYEFIACVTLVTRFAVEGGATSEQAYTLSDGYIQKADETSGRDGVYALYAAMLADFNAMVKRAKTARKPFSRPVVDAIKYIDSNLHYKITLQDVANAANRNPAYLCVHFKKETGIALTQYINREKIAEAKHLLRDTSMTISDIAVTLAFGSQSYFSKTFRELMGETPKEYRQKQVFIHTI